jgi:hypothetical protein
VCADCDSPCSECGTSAYDCTRCRDTFGLDGATSVYLMYLTDSNTCVEVCDDGLYENRVDTSTPVCTACHADCSECAHVGNVGVLAGAAPTGVECTVCNPFDGSGMKAGGTSGLVLNAVTNRCVSDCPDGQWEDSTTNAVPVCADCGSNCLLCEGTATTCTKCNPFSEDRLYLDST